MLLYLVVFGLFAHVLFWGAGLALLAMPRPWLRFWPILAAPAGFALQGLVVWCGAYAGWRGTNSYAWQTEWIPVVLLLAGGWRRSSAASPAGLPRRAGAFLSRPARDIARLGFVWIGSLASLAVLAYPLTRAAKGLTTASLGSCDAADYAAGARVLMEFAHGDRSGFLGLTEVVRIMSVDNFFDFWLRLNHFTPSALIAFNGTIFHCQPHELTGAMAMVILAGTVPVVFWMARAVLGYRGPLSVAIAVLYGFSPITWYAVYGVAIGQILAALAITLNTWAGIALWRGGLGRRRSQALMGVLLIADSLIWGAYNFIVVVCLLPAFAYAAWKTIQAGKNRGRRLLRWLGWMGLPLAAAGLVFWARVAGLVERFELFRTYDFGWRIPALSPEGWLGWVRGTGLEAYSAPWRLLLAAAVLLILIAGLWRGLRARRRSAIAALCLAVPPLLGYFYLTWRGAELGTNASYDAYKLFSVFYPGILPAVCYGWSRQGASLAGMKSAGNLTSKRLAPFLLPLFGAAVVIANLAADSRFLGAMSAPSLIVDRDLIGVGRAEAMPQIDSFNMRVPEMWDRLWANELLLRKPQYFLTHTYEGRLDTPLRGQWDLNGGMISVAVPDGGSVQIDRRFSAVKVASPYYLRASLPENGGGWYSTERLVRTSTVWQWTAPSARILVENPHDRPLRVVFRFDLSSLEPRNLELWNGPEVAAAGRTEPARKWLELPAVTLTSGSHSLELRSDRPASHPAGDGRSLVFQIYAIELKVLRD